MNVWQWLTEPQHIPILAALVALIASVVGGVVTKLVAGVFKTRGDTRQISAANQFARAAEIRWEREQEFEREKLMHASLREACVRYQNQIDEMLPLYWDRQIGRRSVSDDEFDDAWKILYKTASEVEFAVPIMRVPIAQFSSKFKFLDDAYNTHKSFSDKVPQHIFDALLSEIEGDREFLF
jgi:hypothetical protein